MIASLGIEKMVIKNTILNYETSLVTMAVCKFMKEIKVLNFLITTKKKKVIIFNFPNRSETRCNLLKKAEKINRERFCIKSGRSHKTMDSEM